MMTAAPTDDLTETDVAALQLALDLTLADDPPDEGRVEQVTDFLQGTRYIPARPWRDVAAFCAYHQQTSRLGCQPWQRPPCRIVNRETADAILAKGPSLGSQSGTDVSDCKYARLTKQMLKLGISPYHPNPVAAIKDARKRKPKT